MVELLTALGGVRTCLDLVKAAREMLKKDKPDIAAIAGHLSEVQDALFTAREGLGDAQEEIRKLNHQIEELKRFADIGKDFTFEQGVYWLNGFPYCPACWDADRKPIRLAGPLPGIDMGRQNWACPVHNKVNYPISRSFFSSQTQKTETEQS